MKTKTALTLATILFCLMVVPAFAKIYVNNDNVKLGYMNGTYQTVTGYDYLTTLERKDGVWYLNGEAYHANYSMLEDTTSEFIAIALIGLIVVIAVGLLLYKRNN